MCPSNIPEKHEIKEVQKIGHIGTQHAYFRQYYHYKTFNVGNYITCTINCNYRIARIDATLYTLATWFVAGI